MRSSIEYRLSGAVARGYVKRGLGLFQALEKEMSFNDIQSLRRRFPLDPKGKVPGYIDVYKAKNINIVTVHAEWDEYLEEKRDEQLWEPWDGSRGVICVDHLWEFSMRTGIYDYPTAFHSNVTDYFGAAPDPGSGYPGIAALTNPDICSIEYTWPVSGDEVNNFYWPDISGGELKCRCYPAKANASHHYQTFNVIWDNRTIGGSPGDPINPYTNEEAVFLELSVLAYADADAGYGIGETALAYTSSAAFYATDGISIHVWYLCIDEVLYNDAGYIPPGDRPYVSVLGDAFGTGAKGIFLIYLPDYFAGDIVRCGFNVDYPGGLNGKGTPGRDMVIFCDYIDFY